VSDVPEQLREALEARYAPSSLLGRGGMASVYLAEDHKHRRQVALKVLRPDLAASLGADRFLKEIQIAARLNHPHILGLFDSGEAAGFLFYVMPYVEGGSLRQLLERERRLDLGPALAIAGSVADALSYAHRMGVLHRDIKPENILFSQGHPIVADFGIAKAISTAGGANITRTGFPLGTPGYMSPEQAAGLTDLDERTDVYSLAVVVYEMLVGEIPGRWPSEDAVRAGRFLEASAAHRSRLAPLPPAIESALVRGLAIRHDERTASPAELLRQLDGAAPPVLPRRVYSEAEVERIVARAAELEAQVGTQDGAMTIGGVEALAAEVGIKPEIVRAAARAVEPAGTPPPGTPSKVNRIIGGPTRLVFERVVEGELPDTEYETVVGEIRQVMGNVGIVSQLGRSFSWSYARQGGNARNHNVEVLVSIRGGFTRIVVREHLGNLIGGIFGGIGGGLGGGAMGGVIGVGMGVLHSPLSLVALIPMWLATVFSIARTSYHYVAKGRARTLETLADRLEQLVAELVPRGRIGRGSPPLLKS